MDVPDIMLERHHVIILKGQQEQEHCAISLAFISYSGAILSENKPINITIIFEQ